MQVRPIDVFLNMHLMKMPWAEARCLCGSQDSNVAKRQLMVLTGHLSNNRTDNIFEKVLQAPQDYRLSVYRLARSPSGWSSALFNSLKLALSHVLLLK